MEGRTRSVTVKLPEDCASKLTTIAEHEGRTLGGELIWLAMKRVARKMGGAVAKGKNDDEIRVTFRMPRELHDQLREAAERHERNVGAELRQLVRSHVEQGEQAAGPDPLTGR